MVVVFVLQKLPARVSLITPVIKKLDGRENVHFSLQFAYIKEEKPFNPKHHIIFQKKRAVGSKRDRTKSKANCQDTAKLKVKI